MDNRFEYATNMLYNMFEMVRRMRHARTEASSAGVRDELTGAYHHDIRTDVQDILFQQLEHWFPRCEIRADISHPDYVQEEGYYEREFSPRSPQRYKDRQPVVINLRDMVKLE